MYENLKEKLEKAILPLSDYLKTFNKYRDIL